MTTADVDLEIVAGKLANPPADGETAKAGDGSITAALANGGPILDALIGRPASKAAKIIAPLVRVADIVVGKRFRAVDDTEVGKLVESLRESGRLLQPIGVTSDLHLVWGAHRLRAAIDLGWREIPAQILPYDSASPQAKIDELDENLRRCALTALEESQALAARKKAYELLHPDSRRGVRGGRKAKNANLTDTVSVSSPPPPQPVAPVESFASAAARQTGKNERTIRRATAIGAKIVPEVAEAVAKIPKVAKSPKELAKLAKLDPALQRSVAACLTSGECKTVTEAVAESDDPPPAPAEQACDVLKRLLDDAARLWCRKCGKAATAQLAAGVLESVAEDWISQDWRKTNGPRKSTGGR